MLAHDSKHKDRDSNFYPSTFTYKIQKALPNIEDRKNPEKVKEFMKSIV